MTRLWHDFQFWLSERKYGEDGLRWREVRMLSAMGCTCSYWQCEPGSRPHPNMPHAIWCNVTRRRFEEEDFPDEAA